MAVNSCLSFPVHRREPVLVAPALRTPHEFKRLSDIDDQEVLRLPVPVIQFYRYNPSMKAMDPAIVIRDALAKALVPYYPFAGRLRELQDGSRKLVVECTGEGVLFIEADADVSLKQFGDLLHPPFPCLEELLFDVPGSSQVLNSPLLLIQVTRLQCGGFIFALRLNHAMSDAQGLVQFMTAVAEMARGHLAPSITPVWSRELLEARSPPCPSFEHKEYDVVEDKKRTLIHHLNADDVALRSFFFGHREIAALRKHIPKHLFNKTSAFDLITACLWKCRTIALSPDPDEDMRMMFVVSTRGKKSGLNLPIGYYGNAGACPVAISKAEKLCKNAPGYALDLVRKAKSEVNGEYIRSMADLLVLRGRPLVATVNAWMVLDTSRAGFEDVDFGWGKAVYGGQANGAVWGMCPVSFYASFTNAEGEKGILVPLCLPGPAMDKFVQELHALLNVNEPRSAL